MSKIISTKKINACFLVIVLIAGTLAAISPSFMIGAHAQQYGMDQKNNSYESDYGMDNSYDDKKSYGKDSNSYDKSKDSSSTIVKTIKCNNINVNVNGFNGVEVGTLPTALSGLATEVQATEDEGEIGASSSGSGERNSGNFDLDCINTNNNVGGQGGTGSQGPQGPSGIQGERGERGLPGEDGEDGAPGSNQINPALIYPVIGPLSSGTSDANCESGDVVLGGQFQITSGAGHSMGEITNLRAGSSGSGGYSVSIQTLSGSIQGVQANAICFDNPPLKQQLLNQLP